MFVIALGLTLAFSVGTIGTKATEQAGCLTFKQRVGKLPKNLKGFEAAALVSALKLDGRYAFRAAPPRHQQDSFFYAIPLTPYAEKYKVIPIRNSSSGEWQRITIGEGTADEMSESDWNRMATPIGRQLLHNMGQFPVVVAKKEDHMKKPIVQTEWDENEFMQFDSEPDQEEERGKERRRDRG
jgi:hypothetical protein